MYRSPRLISPLNQQLPSPTPKKKTVAVPMGKARLQFFYISQLGRLAAARRLFDAINARGSGLAPGLPASVSCNALATAYCRAGGRLDRYSIDVPAPRVAQVQRQRAGVFRSILVDGICAAGEPDLVCRLLFTSCARQRAAERDVPDSRAFPPATGALSRRWSCTGGW